LRRVGFESRIASRIEVALRPPPRPEMPAEIAENARRDPPLERRRASNSGSCTPDLRPVPSDYSALPTSTSHLGLQGSQGIGLRGRGQTPRAPIGWEFSSADFRLRPSGSRLSHFSRVRNSVLLNQKTKREI
jgi:hypothetical protein